MQEQSKAAAARTPSVAAPTSTYDSAAMERQVRQVKGGGIAAAQVIASRIKPGSISDPAQQSRSGVGAAASATPAATSNQILKCPRCSSLNTKFCYYNNYSLLQPRHFCKNCRRYWTKGGALRNVPVGGGCRKNKRSAATTTAASGGSGTMGPMTAMTTSSPSCATKQGSMNMMIRENSASCRNSSITTAAMITSAVHKAALQESMPPPSITHTHFPSLYSYTSKNGQIQPANSLSNSAASFYNASDQSDLTQYPLLNPRLTPFMPPNQASFHSFLNLKQAISSLASTNQSLISFNASLPTSSAVPFLSNHHHISTANSDAALQGRINDSLMGLDLINASATAPLVHLPSVTTTHSTPSSLFLSNTPSSLAEFHHSNDQSNPAADHQIKSILQRSNEKKLSSLYRNDQQKLQAFGSSSSGSGLQEMRAAATSSQGAQQEEMQAASISKGLQGMQHAAAASAIMEEGHLMQFMSRSSMKEELVSDNFKMKGGEDDLDGDDDPPAAAGGCCTNASWGGGAHRSSFLEASGDDQPYWTCNPSTWPDDLSA